MSFTKKTISSIITIAVSCISCTAFVIFALPVVQCYSQEATAQTVVTKNYSLQDIQTIADGIVEWKKSSLGLSTNGSLIDNEAGLTKNAGESNSDWIAFGAARLHPEQNSPNYIDALSKKIAEYYVKKVTIGVKYTDFQRNSLVMLALKGDPRIVKYIVDGKELTADVISDFSFNMGVKTPLGDQGIASRIWALISIDSMQYSIPSDSKNTRDKLITELLSQQCVDNGFALTGKYSDPDITAMVVQSLAPYYNRTQAYSYTRISSGLSTSKTVQKVIDESLIWLSAIQNKTGDYSSSWSRARNPQTTAQVALALACLGIDPQKDNRFIKGGKSLIDGILIYRNPDKGFKSAFQTTTSDDMPSGQVLYTLAAIIRNMKSMRRLYDLRPEQPSTLKANIAKITAEIAAASDQTSRPKLLSISNSYKLIADSEKMYVYNYTKLYDLLNKKVSTNSITPTSSINSITSNNMNSSGQEPGPSNSSTSNNSETGNESISQSSFLNTSEGMSQSEKDGNSNSKDSGDRNLRIFILVVIIVLIISGATLNFYMIRKARIKRG